MPKRMPSQPRTPRNAERPWWRTLVNLFDMAGRGASTPPMGVRGDRNW